MMGTALDVNTLMAGNDDNKPLSAPTAGRLAMVAIICCAGNSSTWWAATNLEAL